MKITAVVTVEHSEGDVTRHEFAGCTGEAFYGWMHTLACGMPGSGELLAHREQELRKADTWISQTVLLIAKLTGEGPAGKETATVLRETLEAMLQAAAKKGVVL